MDIFSFAKKYSDLLIVIFAALTIGINIFGRQGTDFALSAAFIGGMLIAPLLNGFVFRYHLKKNKLKGLSLWNTVRITLLPILLVNTFFYVFGSLSDFGNFDLSGFLILLFSTFCYQTTLLLVQFKYEFWISLLIDYIMIGIEIILSLFIL